MPTASKSYSKSQENYGDLMWPANLLDAFDYLQIDIKEFIKSSDVISNLNVGTLNPAGGSSSTGVGFSFSDIQSAKTDNKTLETILLPIPDNLQYTDNPSWNDEDVGVLGKTLPSMAKGLLSGDAGGTTTAMQQAAGAGKIGAILEALGPLKNVTTQGLKGKIANPYKEQVFQGIGMRQFDFSWKLVPRSASEQIKIKQIIKIIRENSLPNFSQGESADGQQIERADLASDRWLTVPRTFTLSFKYRGKTIESLPLIKPCVCKNVQVSYTPDNVWATHMLDDSSPAPVAYNLTLSFGETEIITAKDVNSGY
jgi:hypothetical protein